MAAVYQHLLSVPSLQGRLISTSESWSKRAYHAMHWPRIRGLAAKAREMEISAAPWALRLGKELYFILHDYIVS